MNRHHFCHACGSEYEDKERYPRACANCGAMVWVNPIPVSVLLVPVDHDDGRTGLLVIRRGIEPEKGKLALVGGFLEEHESWELGGAREVVEETGVEVDATQVEPVWFTSTEPKPNRVLLFGKTPPVEELGTFEPNDEVPERGLVFGPEGLDEVFAFPLHVEAARRFFAELGVDGAHDYTPA